MSGMSLIRGTLRAHAARVCATENRIWQNVLRLRFRVYIECIVGAQNVFRYNFQSYSRGLYRRSSLKSRVVSFMPFLENGNTILSVLRRAILDANFFVYPWSVKL